MNNQQCSEFVPGLPWEEWLERSEQECELERDAYYDRLYDERRGD